MPLEFQKYAIFAGESVGIYLYKLKWLSWQVMPELSEDVSQQLLIHQFLIGLLAPVSCQLRAVGNTTNLRVACQTCQSSDGRWW